MQRVIDQLSETKDPKLFNRKINKLLDLFDKWEQNLIEREQCLLKNSKKLKNIQSNSSQNNEDTQIRLSQIKIQIQERERQIEAREKILFAEKQEVDLNLKALKQKEFKLQQEKQQIDQKQNMQIQRQEHLEYDKNLQIQAICSRINEKENILQEKKYYQVQMQENCSKQQQLLDQSKQTVMKEWDQIIEKAQQIKRVEQDNKQILLQLRDIHQNIEKHSNILDKKFESLHQIHDYQAYKQQIDDKEHQLKLKEESVRQLQKEVTLLRKIIQKKQCPSIDKQISNQLNNKLQKNSSSHSPNNQTQAINNNKILKTLSQNEFNQSIINSSSSNSGGKNQNVNSKDCNLPKPRLTTSSSASSIHSTNVKKAGNTSKIKQKFSIKNINTDDSQIFSPISKQNPLLSCFSKISPLNQHLEGTNQHQTQLTINSGQNLCTIVDTKSDQASKTPISFDSTNYEYNKMQERRRLFVDQLQDPNDLQIIEEKLYNQLSVQTESHQNSVDQLTKQNKKHDSKSNQQQAQNPSFFRHSNSKNKNRQFQDNQYQSVVKNENDKDYYQNLLIKKQKLLQNYEETNLNSDESKENSVSFTHALVASPSKVRMSYPYQNKCDQ
ncbi:hypothetical protein TTHERM_00193720 (macronuclear) [Tetrahymena thermophila SB210]|uniref:Uncharacterized protein n=1 Tax=Tetrahymena thermophila (strain SB210) TaxID=312017 RepID=Q23KG3_TETTS|nr:hypothetical protein TTHERM_00193720 [Tetrahymena thermophila SB210]EAR96880.1 hypothetical protein TTHERM_00193720 [Tetrahymena thermophila SB210]|eukprot:XP_001017125.1 hypothetical protein TTHERM_00193720 [Tetrahymena thermophila SB210]